MPVRAAFISDRRGTPGGVRLDDVSLQTNCAMA
jgi:hypothetical protein